MRSSRTHNARTRTVAIAIGITAVLAPFTTACGSGSSNGTAGKPATVAKPTDADTGKPDVSSEPSPTAKATGPTIQLGWCTDNAHGVRAVQLLDPQTKDGEIRYFPVEPMVYESNAGCDIAKNFAGYKARTTFDPYFNRLAAQWVKKDDGTYRAGYIGYVTSPEAYNTTFTDLSGISDDTSNGNFGTTPKQSKGYFGRDGMLNFVEDTGNSYQLMTVHPSDSSKPAKSPDDQDVTGITPEDSSENVYTLPNDDTISPGVEKVITEDGHWVSAGDGTISYGQGNEKGKTTEPQYGHTLYPVWVNPAKPTEFIGWDNEKQIVRATISGSKVVAHGVLADPGGTISEVTVDPTGTQAAFILTKGADTGNTTSVELYTVSLKGNGINEPKLVKDLMAAGVPTDSYRIFGWNTVKNEN